jgi:hypothetical protein
MKIATLMSLTLLFSGTCFAQEWTQTVIIDEALCTYDQHGFPDIKVTISPKLAIEGKQIFQFTEAFNYEMCPNLSEVANRLYVPVTFQLDSSYIYHLDKQGICNGYELKTVKMFIPVPNNTSSQYLRLLAPVKNTLKEKNLSIGYCTGGY